MEVTDERYLPEHDADWTLEHTHRYLFARELARGADVLDIACGEGYGSFMLAETAKSVTGVDICQEVVARAQEKYRRPGLTFMQGNILAIPLADASMDVVVSFETLEHLAEHETMLDEIRRVLRPGGLLVISTPDRFEFVRHWQERQVGPNAYHVRELLRPEFEDLLRSRFSAVRILGQQVTFGSVMGAEAGISPAEGFVSWRKGEPDSRTAGLVGAVYLIALASDAPLPPVPSSFLKGAVEESDHAKARAREAEGHIAALKMHVASLESHTANLTAELHAVYASRSWRVTAPLRLLTHCGRNLLRRFFVHD